MQVDCIKMETTNVVSDEKTEELSTAENDAIIIPDKKIRRRKRKLYKSILTQMEFYFSDANLRKDRFLRNLAEENTDGYVPIDIFSKFNKIRNLTTELKDIAMACSKSDMLEVTEDHQFLRRSTPMVPKEDEDSCTIYVEGLPANADHKWIQNTFERFGNIPYISLPRFKSEKIKGFAFVEFDTPKEAKKACKFFRIAMEAAQQCQEENKTNNEETPEQNSKPKRKRGASECEEDLAKKRSRCNTEESEVGNEIPIEEKLETPTLEIQSVVAMEEGDNGKTSKRKRKRKKKVKIQAEPESEVPGLRVMPKEEWKTWKNKYLSLQKAAMSEMKKSLLMDCASLHHLQHPNKSSPKQETANLLSATPLLLDKIPFKPGAVVFLQLENPIWNLKEFKEQAKKIGNVVYIDGKEGDKDIHVRCDDAEASETFLSKIASLKAIGEILSGDEEKKYWEKIHQDRENKSSKTKKDKTHKRGTEKVVLKVVEQRNKHIRFDS